MHRIDTKKFLDNGLTARENWSVLFPHEVRFFFNIDFNMDSQSLLSSGQDYHIPPYTSFTVCYSAFLVNCLLTIITIITIITKSAL